jgi:hypothetical protein
MDDSQSLSMFTHRKTYRVRGPRPCSWISVSSDSSSNEHQDIWPWTIRGPGSRGSTLRSTTLTEPSDSGISSSPSPPLNAPKALVEHGEKPYYRHSRRRKPTGPRAPCFDVRPGLKINTSLHVIPQFQREISPTTPPIHSADTFQSPQTPPITVNSPTNFLLDWDAIFEILGCSETPPDSAGS